MASAGIPLNGLFGTNMGLCLPVYEKIREIHVSANSGKLNTIRIYSPILPSLDDIIEP